MIFLYSLIGLVALLFIVALIAPKKYEVNRSVVINKPLPEVFNYLRMIKNQDHWSPWKKKDPNMAQTFEGKDGEVGFISKWVGNKEVGEGEQEIKNIVSNERIDTELRFFKPWKSVSNGYFTFHEVETNKTEVVWGFQGVNPVPFNLFMLFFNFEKAIKKDFDEGLSELKLILEK